MRWNVMALRSGIVLGVVNMAVFLWADEPAKKPGEAPKKLVLPFDFESKFDDGRYGQTLGDMFWKRLERQGGFIIPESMMDVRQWCQRTKFLPGPDTSLAKIKEIVRREQGSDIGIWGKVERVAGHDADVYDLWIYIVDFSIEPAKTIYEKKVRTRTVSEIPHLYVKEALDRLYGRPDTVLAKAPDPAAEERWAKGPNLVKGDFEKGRAAPLGWDPLPKYVTWISEEGKKPSNRIVRFSFPESVAGDTGVLYYSDYFPVEEGAIYRFQCRWRTTGPAVKVFIKCYDDIATKFQDKKPPASASSSDTQRREVYRSQQNLQGPANTWNIQTEDFTPTHTHYNPRWGRVMLYGYWPAGNVDWDDVVVKQIIPAPMPTKKDARPSLETKVRSDEIKEDR
jgi:hypothetical protein